MELEKNPGLPGETGAFSKFKWKNAKENAIIDVASTGTLLSKEWNRYLLEYNGYTKENPVMFWLLRQQVCIYNDFV